MPRDNEDTKNRQTVMRSLLKMPARTILFLLLPNLSRIRFCIFMFNRLCNGITLEFHIVML